MVSTGCKRVVSGIDAGQSTVEFAVITAAFIVISLALAALWQAVGSGLLVDHALMSASHHVASAMPGNTADVFLY